MRSVIVSLGLIGCLFGCASADDVDTNVVSISDESDVGSLDQELMSALTGAIQFGFQPGSEATCSSQVTNQVCIVPRQKDLRVFYTGGSSSQRQVIRTLVNGWLNAMIARGLSQESDGWHLSEASDVNDPDLTLLIDVDTGNGFCTDEGTSIKDLSCFSGSVTNLTEAPGVKGNYRRWTGVPVLHIDYDDIQNNSSLTTTQKNNLRRQAVFSGLNRFVGIGLVISGDQKCSNRELILDAPCFVTVAQACAANSFGDDGNQTTWLFGGPNCGQ